MPDIQIEGNFSDDITVFVLGGRQPSSDWLKSLKFQTDIWAIDKGVNVCKEANIIPVRLIGDRDSADASAWQWAADAGSSVSCFDSDKDLTDCQLALDMLCNSCDATKGVFLTGCWGGRFDHLWSSIISFISHNGKYRPVAMADEKEGVLFMQGPSKCIFNFQKHPLAISLIPFTKKCQNVYIDGVHWPLDGVTLNYNDPYCISNRLSLRETASVSISNGLLGVYWVW